MAEHKSILVSSFPEAVADVASLSDKLEIYFGKRRNGGGDVEEVHIATRNGQRETSAVITFCEAETVHTVLAAKPHIIFGKELHVDPHPLNGVDAGDTSEAALEMSPGVGVDSGYKGLSENHDNWTKSEQKVKLVLEGPVSQDILETVTSSTRTTFEVDEKSARFILTGCADDVMQAAVKLQQISGWNDSQGLGSELEMTADYFMEDETSSGHGRGCRFLQTEFRSQNSQSSSSSTEIKSRNLAKFNPKILDYIDMNAACREAVNAIRDKFMVNFECRTGGVVHVSSRGPEINQQNIRGAIEALEDLVKQTKESGLITRIVDMRRFQKAQEEALETAIDQAMRSTLVLVTQGAKNMLFFFGTERDVEQEIKNLEEAVNNEQDPDEPLPDSDSENEVMENGEKKSGQEFSKQVEEDPTRIDEGALAFPEDGSNGGLAQLLSKPTVSSANDFDSFVPQQISKSTMDVPSESPDEMEMDTSDLHFDAVVCLGASLAMEVTGNGETLENGDRHLVETDSSHFPPTCKGGTEESYNVFRVQGRGRHLKEESRIKTEACVMHGTSHSLGRQEEGHAEVPENFTFIKFNERTASREVHSLVHDPKTQTIPPPAEDQHIAKSRDISQHQNGTKPKIRKDFETECMQSLRGSIQDPSEEEQARASVEATEWDVDSGGNIREEVKFEEPTSSRAREESSSQQRTPDTDFTITMRRGFKVIIRQGDITDEFTDVIVSTADPNLRLVNGLGREVRIRAGQELIDACQSWIRQRGRVGPGKVVWTTAGNLTCSHVLHVVPPRKNGDVNIDLEALRKMFLDILKACAYSLKASMVSMAAIGAETFASEKLCANAFLDAVVDFSQSYQGRWMQLTTVVLVDKNPGTVEEFQRVFSDAILSGLLEESVPGEEHDPEDVPGSAMSASSSDHEDYGFAVAARFWQQQSGARPRLRARGPNHYRNQRGRRSKRPAGLSTWHPSAVKGKGEEWPDAMEEAKEVERSLSPQPENMCPVCHGEIRNEKRLPCGHRFCRVCVDTAMKMHNYCPLCKQPA